MGSFGEKLEDRIWEEARVFLLLSASCGIPSMAPAQTQLWFQPLQDSLLLSPLALTMSHYF